MANVLFAPGRWLKLRHLRTAETKDQCPETLKTDDSELLDGLAAAEGGSCRSSAAAATFKSCADSETKQTLHRGIDNFIMHVGMGANAMLPSHKKTLAAKLAEVAAKWQFRGRCRRGELQVRTCDCRCPV